MFYFAYGSNLSETQMKERCPYSKLLAPGLLKDYKLGFTRYSPGWSGGVADVIENKGSVVWGLVYEIIRSDLKELDSYEGYSDFYTRFQQTIYSFNREFNSTWIYKVIEKSVFIPPTKRYLNIIIEAANKYDFPKSYKEYLNSFL